MATQEFTDDLRRWGLTVELEVTEYVPGRRGLGPVEWTLIFIGTSAGTKIIGNLTDDLYNAAKELLRRRKKRGAARRKLGFTIYGPDGMVEADDDIVRLVHPLAQLVDRDGGFRLQHLLWGPEDGCFQVRRRPQGATSMSSAES